MSAFFVSKNSGISHSGGFCLVLAQFEKGSRIFNPSNPSLFLSKKLFFSRLFAQNQVRFDGLKIPERLFSLFQIEHRKKPLECANPEFLETKCVHSKPFSPTLVVPYCVKIKTLIASFITQRVRPHCLSFLNRKPGILIQF